MGQLSPLIWQLSRPSAITLILPHSCLLTGIALRAWAVHTPSISWAPISWAALCVWTYIHTIIQAVHTPPSSWVPISWAAPRAWTILHDYHMPDSVAQHSMNPPYDVCSPLVCNSECMRVNNKTTWSASAILSLIFQLCLYVANAYLAAHFIPILVSKLVC